MKHKNGCFAVILFIYWSRFCILYSFASMFFQRQGFSAAQIGELAAVSGLAAVFGGPAAGMLADKIRSESKVILMCLVFTLFLTGGVYIGRSSFWSLLFPYGAVSLFDKAISPLLDSWVVKYGKEQYGKIRAVGSLGGALCAIVIGIVIDRFGFGTVFKIHMLLTAVMFVLVLFMKRGDTMTHQEHSGYIKEKEKQNCGR